MCLSHPRAQFLTGALSTTRRVRTHRTRTSNAKLDLAGRSRLEDRMFRGYYADAEPFWRVKYGVLSIPDNVDRYGQLVRPCVYV